MGKIAASPDGRNMTLRPVQVGFRRLALGLGISLGFVASALAFGVTMDAEYDARRTRAKIRIAAEYYARRTRAKEIRAEELSGRTPPDMSYSDMLERFAATSSGKSVEERLKDEQTAIVMRSLPIAVPVALIIGGVVFSGTWGAIRALGWIVYGFVCGDLKGPVRRAERR